ncbi:hypothetical protein ACWDBD_47435 [Streptomyces sp. NPDC001118]
MNAAGAELGLTPTYTKSAVSQWLAGHPPKPRARPAITEALSRLLGRPVTSFEAGFDSDADTVASPDLVSWVVDLGRADMDPSRRAVLGAGLYSAALVAPAFADESDRVKAVTAGRATLIGQSDVSTVERMTERIADILDDLGGGHARPMAAAFLVNTVGPYLRADAPDSVKRAMRAAASDLMMVCTSQVPRAGRQSQLWGISQYRGRRSGG